MEKNPKKMILKEKVDYVRCQEFITFLKCNKEETLVKIYQDYKKKIGDRSSIDDFKNFRKNLLKFQTRLKNNVLDTEYVAEKGYGRYYLKEIPEYKRVAQLPKIFRNYFTSETYHELDICNCDYSILGYLFKKYEIECEELNSFNSEKKYYMEHYKIDKSKLQSILKAKEISVNIEFFNNIRKKTYKELIPKLEKDYSYIVPSKKKGNELGSFLSLVL